MAVSLLKSVSGRCELIIWKVYTGRYVDIRVSLLSMVQTEDKTRKGKGMGGSQAFSSKGGCHAVAITVGPRSVPRNALCTLSRCSVYYYY